MATCFAKAGVLILALGLGACAQATYVPAKLTPEQQKLEADKNDCWLKANVAGVTDGLFRHTRTEFLRQCMLGHGWQADDYDRSS